MKFELDPHSIRARKARLARRIGLNGSRMFTAFTLLFGLAGVGLYFSEPLRRFSFFSLSFSAVFFLLVRWYARDLNNIDIQSGGESLDTFLEPSLLAVFREDIKITPKTAWILALHTWQASFILNHLQLKPETIADTLSDIAEEMPAIWQRAYEFSTKQKSHNLDSGALAAALLTISPPTVDYLKTLNLSVEDVMETYHWQARLDHFLDRPKPYFGGFGRDWAAGFTPTLDKYARDISEAVEMGRAGHFHTLAHADILDTIIHNLSQGTGAVALVGDNGTGKTALTYALAQRLLEGEDKALQYYRIVSLNASLILSSSASKLEQAVLTLLGEAVHARNVIIFLDEASLFFGEGAGAFDMGQILLPILQNRQVKLIAALTPGEYQKLKSRSEPLVGTFGVVAVKEPSAEATMQILEDTALTFEQRDKLLISYGAVREAYRLSGQYIQEEAYPGKAIALLQQAVPFARDKVITAESIQNGLEKTRGVRVSKAQNTEADVLLHLEERIHQRMINQTRAVNVVASALRRGRAGVANPKRPTGSFLFLGPTGVGKTELARSLAATYFGDEHQMIRLDMSEYQQPEDASRLLDSGASANKSLILSIREQPFSVVLLDEVEKAHPNILNLLLQLLDEGQLTDQNGKAASFRNAIVIATSNAGSAEISQRVGSGENLDDFERPLINKLINSGDFRPELINRFDEVVLFRPLNEAELGQVAALMLSEVNKTLSSQNVSVQLTDAALQLVVKNGFDPEFGARPMRRTIQKMVEDVVATRLLNGQAKAGSTITLDVDDLSP